MRSLRLKLNGKDYLFHVGQFPDMQGRKKELIIREGKVGVWRELQIEEGVDSDECYYEVVVNRKVNALILEKLSKAAKARVG